jgi:serine/threonine-protein kinase
LQRLAEGSLTDAELARLEEHLQGCPKCQTALDRLADGWLGATRRYLAEDRVTRPETTAPAGPSLDFLAPSDWPDSLGRLGSYEVKGLLGCGGMGVVLKAVDPALNRTVAIKVLAAHLASNGASRQRFMREARAAAAVAHEHVVAVHAVSEAGDLPYLVMEYVPGRSLQERLDRQGPLPLPEILRIGMQAAAGLAAAHAQGLVHRDIKPANILLENGIERVRLTDFGLARAASDGALTQSGVVAGTPQYMAPEQARGEAVDYRADLFSLGSTLYAMCTGHPPFRAESAVAVLRRVSDDEPRSVRELNAEVPVWLAAIIARLHAKNPAQRFQTAAEVAGLLGGCLAHLQQPLTVPLPSGLPSGLPPLHGPGPRRVRLAWWALASVALLSALAAAPFAWRLWRPEVDTPVSQGAARIGDLTKESTKEPANETTKQATVEVEADTIIGTPKTVTPDWSATRFVGVAPPNAEWKVAVSPAPEVKFARYPIVPLPARRHFFERCEALVVNAASRRALVGYHWNNKGQTSSRLLLCDLEAAQVLNEFVVDGAVTPLAISDSGRQALLKRTSKKKDTAEIWRLSRKECAKMLEFSPADKRGRGHDLRWGAFLPGNRLLTASFSVANVVLWELPSARPIYELQFQGQSVAGLSHDRKLVAFTTGTQLGILDVDAGKVIAMQPTHKWTPFAALSFSPGGKWLACGAMERLFVWDLATGALHRDMRVNPLDVWGYISWPTERTLFTGNKYLIDLDRSYRFWEYQKQNHVQIAGARGWFVTHEGQNGAIVPAPVPSPEALEALEKALPDLDREKGTGLLGTSQVTISGVR